MTLKKLAKIIHQKMKNVIQGKGQKSAKKESRII